MGMKYYKLLNLLKQKGMKKTDLLQILSSGTIAKLDKGEYISGEAVEKICLFLNCQPGDIMEVYKTINYTDANGNEQTKEILVGEDEKMELIRALLNNPMFGTVTEMYKEAAKTDEEKQAVNQAMEVFDKFTKPSEGE